MHFYIIEPDRTNQITPVYYFGNFQSVDTFLLGRDMTFVGVYDERPLMHFLDEYGGVNVVMGYDEPQVFEVDTALVEAQRWFDKERSVDIKYMAPDGTKGVLSVTPHGIVDRSEQ